MAPLFPGSTEPQEARACREAVYPQHWQLRIARRPIGLAREKMGISDARGCYADLFYEQMEEWHEKSKVSLASLLRHVAAHETGHLLLGTNSHTPGGSMLAVWESGELASAGKGRFFLNERIPANEGKTGNEGRHPERIHAGRGGPVGD